jgi:glycosyltransferase involved in cell wall biosynthesis
VKILHVIPTYVPAYRHGGPVFATHGLAQALVRAGHEVTVFTTNVHEREDLAVPLGLPVAVDGVTVRYFPTALSRRLYVSPPMGKALQTKVAGFDVLHLHSLFLWPAAAAGYFARRAGVPYLVAPRGMLVRALVAGHGALRKRLWLSLVDRRLLEAASGLHLTSALEVAEAEGFGYRLPPRFVVPNGLDAAALAHDPAEPPSPALARALEAGPFFLYLGRLSWKKGLDRLVEAVARVPAARLLVAGNDEEGLRLRLEAQAAQLGAAARVAFLGAVAGPDKTWLLRRATALVLASSSENFGNVVLESWAAGRPVVVTPEVGLAPEVEAAGAGWVTAAAPEALAATLTEVLAQPTAADEAGRRGAVHVTAHFSWDSVARRMAAVYEQVRGDRRIL